MSGIGAVANVLVGDVYLRAADLTDIAAFAAGITDAAFETAFPVATSQYQDASGEAEYNAAPSGTYRAGDGNNESPMLQSTGVLRFKGLTVAELKTAIDTFQNTNVDLCIKNSLYGDNGLGDGAIFRNINVWIGSMMTRNAGIFDELQWDKLIPAKEYYNQIQRFNIVAI